MSNNLLTNAEAVFTTKAAFTTLLDGKSEREHIHSQYYTKDEINEILYVI